MSELLLADAWQRIADLERAVKRAEEIAEAERRRADAAEEAAERAWVTAFQIAGTPLTTTH